MIASDIGGHRELIRNNETGLLFKAGDVDRLADSLVKILDDSDLRETLKKQGPLWVRKNKTWDKTTEVYDDIYGRLLG